MTLDPLQTLLIQHACAQAINRFATLNDVGDYAQLAELFSEDGDYTRPSQPEELISGRTAILASLTARPARKTRHLVSNIEVIVTGPDSAHASSSIALYVAALGSDMAVSPFLIGRYDDDLVRQDDRWLFRSRRGRVELRVHFAE